MDINCKGTDCPMKDTCHRYSPEPTPPYFSEPPVKDGKCIMYWGADQQSIYEQLKEIMK
jgi:hypothetical protein